MGMKGKLVRVSAWEKVVEQRRKQTSIFSEFMMKKNFPSLWTRQHSKSSLNPLLLEFRLLLSARAESGTKPPTPITIAPSKRSHSGYIMHNMGANEVPTLTSVPHHLTWGRMLLCWYEGVCFVPPAGQPPHDYMRTIRWTLSLFPTVCSDLRFLRFGFPRISILL